jgi:hypothetical protein
MGDERPIQLLNVSSESLEHMVTFQRPGSFVVKLTVRNGDQLAEVSDIATVMSPPRDSLVALFEVADQGTEVQTFPKDWRPVVAFPDGTKDTTFKFERATAAPAGDDIADVIPMLPNGNEGPGLQGKLEMAIDGKQYGFPNSRNLLIKLEPDRKIVRFTGELDRDKRSTAAPLINLPFTLVLQKKATASRPKITVAANLTAPGSTEVALPPAPAGWLDWHRQVHFKLSDGNTVILDQTQLLHQADVPFRNHRYLLTCTAEANQVKLDLR